MLSSSTQFSTLILLLYRLIHRYTSPSCTKDRITDHAGQAGHAGQGGQRGHCSVMVIESLSPAILMT